MLRAAAAGDQQVRSVVILGGGTAGWMTAAALAKFLPREQYRISLVESEAIGTVGVGEATVPHLRFFNQALGLDEQDFMRKTQATYKLGIEFSHWGALGEAYIHPFGLFGASLGGVNFHHYWLRAKQLAAQSGGDEPAALGEYSAGVMVAQAEKFAYPERDPNSPLAKYAYAFHLDASLYAGYLREFAEARAVQRREGRIQQFFQDADRGAVTGLALESGEQISGDFFIDCTGFASLLLGKTLNTEFESWAHWLPCDTALAVPSELSGPPRPYSRAIAQPAGWQWQIPLQQRMGNGFVYASDFMARDLAEETFTRQLPGEPLAPLRQLTFTAGRRRASWVKNCVGIGLSSGFLEPLESTSIYLIQVAIMKLVEVFPSHIHEPLLAREFNRDMAMEYERVRDFLILHYHATRREDSDFWNYCRTMKIPASLQRKIELFLNQGEVESYSRGMFLEPSWLAVYLGQGLEPRAFNPRAAQMPAAKLHAWLGDLRQQLQRRVRGLPSHQQALQRLSSEQAAWPAAAMSLYSVFS